MRSRRKEGPEKLTGVAKYIDDFRFQDVLHAVTVRATVPRGRIKQIHFDPSFDWTGVVVATADDIPGENTVLLIERDQPVLARDEVRHVEEPLLVLGHPDRAMAYDASKHVRIDYDPLEPVLDPERSSTVFKSFEIQKGDLEAGFAEADAIVEEEYRVPHQEQAYIETNGIAAWEESDGTLVVLGSMQCPYYVHKALLPIFPRDPGKIRVIQAATGGGFGGKEEYPNIIAAHAALLALKAKRPVKLVYDRHEDMRATTKRHPARIRHRTGVRRDGTLVAQDIDVLMDGGAYITLSPVVLSRGILHASGPYECPNVRIRGRVVATNTPPNGAFRGFGAPQTLFAAELHMEKIAKTLGIDSVALRRKNLFRLGSTTATGQVLRESVGARQTLDRALEKSQYSRRKKAAARWNRVRKNPTWRGVGLATVFHGAGFTGSGEIFLKSRAGVRLTPAGDIVVDAASTEIGQGTTSILAQIVAEALDVPYEWIRVETPDTNQVPNSGPTVASRTCMIVGGLLERSADKIKERLAADGVRWPLTRAALRGKNLSITEEFEKPGEIEWDEETYRGDAYGAYGYATLVAEVEVDKLTYEVTIRDVVTAQDVGRAINPLLVEGQILGGTVQGIGYALLENVVFENGAMANAQFTNYVIPTTLDTPPIRVEIVEEPYSRGPFGAKGVGELPMDVPAPAIVAAIHDATGLFLTALPALPEQIEEAFHDRAPRQR
ncbi:MAG TPA: xanthine dehydrogenase family protein molybdopterin-binding subunit [Vicinamibacteria bacterium]|nr:xanthine dehydrogenase family protein molybdopterin-binding subunit [Vicinamibacteria bacterium]